MLNLRVILCNENLLSEEIEFFGSHAESDLSVVADNDTCFKHVGECQSSTPSCLYVISLETGSSVTMIVRDSTIVEDWNSLRNNSSMAPRIFFFKYC